METEEPEATVEPEATEEPEEGEKPPEEEEGEEEQEAEEEVDKSLTETEILVRMGPVTPEAGEDGLKGVFINLKNYLTLGLVDATDRDENIPFSGMNTKPYVLVEKKMLLDDVKKMACASDWHPYNKDLEKFPGDQILLILDPNRTFGDKFVMPIKQNS
jgi:hypothetical protein